METNDRVMRYLEALTSRVETMENFMFQFQRKFQQFYLERLKTRDKQTNYSSLEKTINDFINIFKDVNIFPQTNSLNSNFSIDNSLNEFSGLTTADAGHHHDNKSTVYMKKNFYQTSVDQKDQTISSLAKNKQFQTFKNEFSNVSSKKSHPFDKKYSRSNSSSSNNVFPNGKKASNNLQPSNSYSNLAKNDNNKSITKTYQNEAPSKTSTKSTPIKKEAIDYDHSIKSTAKNRNIPNVSNISNTIDNENIVSPGSRYKSNLNLSIKKDIVNDEYSKKSPLRDRTMSNESYTSNISSVIVDDEPVLPGLNHKSIHPKFDHILVDLNTVTMDDSYKFKFKIYAHYCLFNKNNENQIINMNATVHLKDDPPKLSRKFVDNLSKMITNKKTIAPGRGSIKIIDKDLFNIPLYIENDQKNLPLVEFIIDDELDEDLSFNGLKISKRKFMK